MSSQGRDPLEELTALASTAPPDTMPRLKRRLRVLQPVRDLIEHQAFAFWVVIDTFLRLLFGSKPDAGRNISEEG